MERSLAVAHFPSLDLLCGTVCRLNFGWSTVRLSFYISSTAEVTLLSIGF